MTRKDLVEKYGCDGFCYGGIDQETGKEYPICGGIDICEETAHAKGIAGLVACLIISLFPIAICILLFFLLLK